MVDARLSRLELGDDDRLAGADAANALARKELAKRLVVLAQDVEPPRRAEPEGT